MQLNIQIQGQAATQRRIADLPRQMRFAGAQALNGAAFKLREDWRAEIRRVFDRPTPYVEASPFVVKMASRESLQAWVRPRYAGGKGVDPEKVLLAEVFGGVRRPKRFERALQAAGILPSGMAAVPATWVLADSSMGDGYGGVKGSFIVRLISYLQAFGEQGYRANMTARNRAKLSGKGRWVNGRFYAATTKVGASRQGAAAVRQGGVEYFVSRGRGTSTPSKADAARGWFADGREQHLAAGIWQRSGSYGVIVKPVFLFTRAARYQARLDLRTLADRAMRVHLPPLYRAALARALETAR